MTSVEEKIRELMRRLDRVEAMLEAELEDLKKDLRVIKALLELNAKIVHQTLLVKKVSHLGDVAQYIVRLLYDYGTMNISQLVKALKEERGRGSRTTVIKKLRALKSMGVVEEVEGRRSEKRYRLKGT